MTIYTFDTGTYQFLYEYEATRDPLENKILMPPNATTIKPPSVKSGELLIYNKRFNRWDIIIDHRGKWYEKETGEEREITTIYDTSLNSLTDRISYDYQFNVLKLKDGTSLVRENPEDHPSMLPFECLEWSFHNKKYELKKDITSLKNYIKKCVSEYKDETLKQNVYFNESPIQTCDSSLLEMSKIILSHLSDRDYKIGWVDANNEVIDMNVGALDSLYRFIISRNEQIYNDYQNFRNAIEKVSNYKELEELFPNYLEWLQFYKKAYGYDYDWKRHIGSEPRLSIFDKTLKQFNKLEVKVESSILSQEELDSLVDSLPDDAEQSIDIKQDAEQSMPYDAEQPIDIEQDTETKDSNE